MFNNKIDTNDITVFVRFDSRYEHPVYTMEAIYVIVYAVCEYYEKLNSNDLKKSIDIDILKSVLKKVSKKKSDLWKYDKYIKKNQEDYWEKNDILDSPYAIPVIPIEITLSELIIMYRTLEYCKENQDEIRKYMHLYHSRERTYEFINDIQRELESRLRYAIIYR